MSRLSQLQQFELLTYLPGDLLTKEDRATMSVGLEGRVPLLDDEVASVAARLPERDRASVLRGKVALRRLARRRLGAVEVPLRKRGFAVPLDSLFAGAWRSESIEWFSGGTSELVAGRRVARMIEAGEPTPPTPGRWRHWRPGRKMCVEPAWGPRRMRPK